MGTRRQGCPGGTTLAPRPIITVNADTWHSLEMFAPNENLAFTWSTKGGSRRRQTASAIVSEQLHVHRKLEILDSAWEPTGGEGEGGEGEKEST